MICKCKRTIPTLNDKPKYKFCKVCGLNTHIINKNGVELLTELGYVKIKDLKRDLYKFTFERWFNGKSEISFCSHDINEPTFILNKTTQDIKLSDLEKLIMAMHVRKGEIFNETLENTTK